MIMMLMVVTLVTVRVAPVSLSLNICIHLCIYAYITYMHTYKCAQTPSNTCINVVTENWTALVVYIRSSLNGCLKLPDHIKQQQQPIRPSMPRWFSIKSDRPNPAHHATTHTQRHRTQPPKTHTHHTKQNATTHNNTKQKGPTQGRTQRHPKLSFR